MVAAISDVLSIVGMVVVIAGLVVLLKRIDPHWVAKDGKAFTCKLQPLRATGQVEGRWREARAVVRDGQVRLVMRGIGSTRITPYEAHRVTRRAESPPPRTAVFLLDGDPMWALRVPASSRAVPVLEALIED